MVEAPARRHYALELRRVVDGWPLQIDTHWEGPNPGDLTSAAAIGTMEVGGNRLAQRRHYRVGTRVKAKIRSEDWSAPCAVDNIAIEGARIRIKESSGRVLSVGASAELRVLDPQTGNVLVLSASVTYRDENDTPRAYGLHFTDREQVRALFTPALAKLFNRRQSFRVSLDSSPLFATLQPPQQDIGLIETAIVDVSTLGCAVLVTAQNESALQMITEVDLLFKLPGATLPCALRGDIRYREATEEGMIRYGIEFLEGTDAEYSRSMDQIIKFVMRNQNEQL